MKVLMCHNHYQQHGGEDGVFDTECALLEQHGHTVLRFTMHNDDIKGMSPLRVLGKTFWNGSSYHALRALMQRERPDVMHCVNTFPLISPAAYDAAHAEGVPVVQALHNYRLLCAGAKLMRDDVVCESCLGRRFGLPGVIHRCYRDSFAQSLVLTTMTATHHALGTYARKVDLYMTVGEFARDKHIEGGLPADRVVAKPNFIAPDPGLGTGAGGYAVFVGRLSPEKGVDVMLDAWDRIGSAMRLKIVGDGPLAQHVKAAATRNPAIEWLGFRKTPQVMQLVGDASCLVMPSVWYEGLPRTILEAFARGTPPIVSELGAMSELVEHERTGLRFRVGDSDHLAEQVLRLHADPGLHRRLRDSARAEFLAKYTSDVNYPLLMSVYRRAIESYRQRSPEHRRPDAAPRATSVEGQV